MYVYRGSICPVSSGNKDYAGCVKRISTRLHCSIYEHIPVPSLVKLAKPVWLQSCRIIDFFVDSNTCQVCFYLWWMCTCMHALLIDASHFSNATALRRHCRAGLEQQTLFARPLSGHKEILLNIAECGPESDCGPRKKVLCQRKTLLCKQLPLVNRWTCSWTYETACVRTIG